MDARRPAVTALAALALAAGCGSDDACQPSAVDTNCPDLAFRGGEYVEWRVIDAPPPQDMQEVGNARYPDCNDEDCEGIDLEGFGHTDVWLLKGVEIEDAVIGVREGTDTYVVFVRIGVDPDTLTPEVSLTG